MLKKILAATARGAAALLSPAHAGEVDTDPMTRTSFYIPLQIGTGFTINSSVDLYGYDVDVEGRKVVDVSTGIGYDFSNVRADYRLGQAHSDGSFEFSDGSYDYSGDAWAGARVSALGVAIDVPTNSRVVTYVGVDLTGAYNTAGEMVYGVTGKAGFSYLAFLRQG